MGFENGVELYNLDKLHYNTLHVHVDHFTSGVSGF